MFTLLVTAAASEQESGVFRMESNRFLEWTDESIVNQLRSLSNEAIAALISWPCVLMEEGRSGQIVRIGRVTQISMGGREVSINFEPLDFGSPLTNDDLWKLSGELDIGDFEFSRNHISVKDRNLFRALSESGYEIDNIVSASFLELQLPRPERKDLLKAREVIGAWGHTEIDDLLPEIGSSELGASRGASSRRDRANAIVRYSLEHPDAKTAENSLLSVFLIQRTASSPRDDESDTSSLTSAWAQLPPPLGVPEPAKSSSSSPNRVFVVHGQNEAARAEVAQHLRNLGLKPIVLHEQANMGRHLLTKFIQEAELVTFAVVLMTDDDMGSKREEEPRPRARQNVILELGYFLSHLRQNRVCALITPGLETPSDFDGIVYIRMDTNGQWREELTRELRAADMPIKNIGAGTA